jgi:hypothetical protein
MEIYLLKQESDNLQITVQALNHNPERKEYVNTSFTRQVLI